MSIKLTTPKDEIARKLNQLVDRQKRAIVLLLSYVGIRCTNIARTNGNYIDRTGNLRSSVGYVVAMDGNIQMMSDFVAISGQDGNGQDGTSVGKEYAKALISKYPKGIVLVIVAGMHYAKYVAATGRDVLDSAELTAKRLIPRMLNDLKIEINNADF